jgi:hypothetical protein
MLYIIGKLLYITIIIFVQAYESNEYIFKILKFISTLNFFAFVFTIISFTEKLIVEMFFTINYDYLIYKYLLCTIILGEQIYYNKNILNIILIISMYLFFPEIINFIFSGIILTDLLHPLIKVNIHDIMKIFMTMVLTYILVLFCPMIRTIIKYC